MVKELSGMTRQQESRFTDEAATNTGTYRWTAATAASVAANAYDDAATAI